MVSNAATLGAVVGSGSAYKSTVFVTSFFSIFTMLSLLSGSLRSVAVVRALPVLPLVRRLGLPAFMVRTALRRDARSHIQEKAKQPKHVGSFDKAEKDVGTGLVCWF